MSADIHIKGPKIKTQNNKSHKESDSPSPKDCHSRLLGIRAYRIK